eukprot:3708682-Pleurochrysis_carterae.AAC.1
MERSSSCAPARRSGSRSSGRRVRRRRCRNGGEQPHALPRADAQNDVARGHESDGDRMNPEPGRLHGAAGSSIRTDLLSAQCSVEGLQPGTSRNSTSNCSTFATAASFHATRQL